MTAVGDWVAVTRPCPVVAIPSGDPTSLAEGQRVLVVQTLGASVTVRAEDGRLLRVDATDGDAIGLERPGRHVALFGSGPFAMTSVTDALQTVYDPEIPVSIVELGLVYRCEEEIDADGRRRIIVDLSMTAPGCGMGDVLRADAARVIAAVPGVDEVEVALVWDPPWSVERISEAARLELGLL